MRDESEGDKLLPYKLGECLVKDCGCIFEHRPNGSNLIYDCPEHTEKKK